MLKFSKKLFLYNFFTQVKKKKKRKKSFDPKSSDQRQAAKTRHKIFPVFVLTISVGVLQFLASC